MATDNKWVNAVAFAAVVLGLLVCLAVIAFHNCTQTEGLLLSLMLTIFSVLGSWLASRYYSEASFAASLRTFALKASEKVNNLSNELDRLSGFLQQAEDEEAGGQHALTALQMRIEGAVHIIQTLKSVNDRSLSDWQGVIGEEIDAQREENAERVEELRELVDRVESLHTSHVEDFSSFDENAADLRANMDSIRKELRQVATQLGGPPIVRPPRSVKADVTARCPSCEKVLAYRQRRKPASSRLVVCDGCGAKLVSAFSDDRFNLVLRQTIDEKVACPGCGSDVTVALDNLFPGGTPAVANCGGCRQRLDVHRGAKGVVSVRLVPSVQAPMVLDEKAIEKVKAVMPPQPWPKGAAKNVVKQLGMSPRLVEQALRELVRRGVFKLQIDGKLYVAEQQGASVIAEKGTGAQEPPKN